MQLTHESGTKTHKNGTVENPEVFENVPGHVIPIIAQEFEDFESEADKFLDGNIEESQYIGFRLKQGVYGQRQPGVNMTRVKLPFGGITADQMDAFGDVSESHAPLKKAHITTRQAVQIHHIPLAKMHEVLRHISISGLSSREGCGNTVRNVTGDPFAGILEGEVFDPSPWAGAFVRYWVRNELTQLLPRKCKVAFSGYADNRALTDIHDIAFEAKINDEGEPGFRMLVGGGTSIFPRLAPELFEWVSFDEYLKVSEAVLRIFDRCDELRVNRARARIKVYIDRIGMDAFREEVLEEMKQDWALEGDFNPEPLLFVPDEEGAAPSVSTEYAQPTDEDRAEFEAFTEHNVFEQKQAGYSAVMLKVYRGDLSPEQWHGVADITRKYSSGFARTTVTQNLVLRFVPTDAVYEVWSALKELGLGDPGADTIQDVVSCPGTDSCKLGITASMGLNAAVHDRLKSMNITDPLTKKTVIRMSGCPNGCSQHHIASIGFNGASMKFDGQQVPAYIVQVGGRGANGKVNFGTRLKVRIPAKRAPEAVERWLRLYESDRVEGEEFSDFVDRVGAVPFEDAARDLTLPVEVTEDKDTFVDWQRSGLFKVERGEGECAV
ncbi:MAG: nitrite/sulfite reductase [Thermoleophilaceae bacterium]|nr:nitrite/sulfite reductase [Thermoleophilaceae bacterium]